MSNFTVFVVVGYRGTNGWPAIYMMNFTLGMTREDFMLTLDKGSWFPDDEIDCCSDCDNKKRKFPAHNELITVFKVPQNSVMRMEFLTDCNTALWPGVEQFDSIEEFFSAQNM